MSFYGLFVCLFSLKAMFDFVYNEPNLITENTRIIYLEQCGVGVMAAVLTNCTNSLSGICPSLKSLSVSTKKKRRKITLLILVVRIF